jgi:hypothetical protein
MGAAPLPVLPEHGQHGDNIKIVARAKKRRAAVLAAAPRNGCARIGYLITLAIDS